MPTFCRRCFFQYTEAWETTRKKPLDFLMSDWMGWRDTSRTGRAREIGRTRRHKLGNILGILGHRQHKLGRARPQPFSHQPKHTMG